MTEFTADDKGGEGFFDDLEEYMKKNVLKTNGEFICKKEEDCERSCKEQNVGFYKGQLHHVGRLYDLKRDGKPFRIMISGGEYGSPDEYISMTKRSECIDKPPSNPHMQGTLLLLQMLFEQENGNEKQEVMINQKSHSIFKAFSLVNFLLCSAIKEESPYGKSPKQMKENCGNHFYEAIKILQPQIIILQGDRAKKFFESSDINLNYKNPEVEKIEIEGKTILVLPLHHPSAPRPNKKFPGMWGNSLKNAATGEINKPTQAIVDNYSAACCG